MKLPKRTIMPASTSCLLPAPEYGKRLGSVTQHRTRAKLAKRGLRPPHRFLVDLVFADQSVYGDVSVVDQLLNPSLVASRVPLVRALLVYDENSWAHEMLCPPGGGRGR